MKIVHKNAMGENWDGLINPEGEVLNTKEVKEQRRNVSIPKICVEE